MANTGRVRVLGASRTGANAGVLQSINTSDVGRCVAHTVDG